MSVFARLSVCNSHITRENTHAAAVKTPDACQYIQLSRRPVEIHQQTSASYQFIVTDSVAVNLSGENSNHGQVLKSEEIEDRLSNLLNIDSKTNINKNNTVNTVNSPKNNILDNYKHNETNVSNTKESFPVLTSDKIISKITDKDRANAKGGCGVILLVNKRFNSIEKCLDSNIISSIETIELLAVALEELILIIAIVFGGDINAKDQAWDNYNNNRSEKTLFKYLTNNKNRNCEIKYSDEPTHFPTFGLNGSTLDIFLTNRIKSSKPLPHNELSPDHL
ncbi:hypothetical protein PV326_006922 [Microctonus aethiopoides]|nr:hypothetical protein PV326_006922 [Microctonus aethiopoides]